MRTTFTDIDTAGLGEIELAHPEGSFEPTPASRIGLRAIGAHRHLLHGVGLDWGCGIGVLAIAAARLASVSQVIGLDIEPVNIEQATENAARNGVADKVVFYLADSVTPVTGATTLEAVTGRVGFVLANPPASVGDDGFEFRRRVVRDVEPILAVGGVLLLNVSSQYGMGRITALEDHGLTHERLLESTRPMPFDQSRPDLAGNLADYVAEEARGGIAYEFLTPESDVITATEALARYDATGESPLSRWQVHLFRKP